MVYAVDVEALGSQYDVIAAYVTNAPVPYGFQARRFTTAKA
jgi:hypothetical protein